MDFSWYEKRAKTKGSKSICPEEKVAELTSLFVKNGYKPFALNGEPKELKSVDEWPSNILWISDSARDPFQKK